MTMKYRTIPGTDLTPSVICYGTSSIGSRIERNESFRLLDVYAGLGGTFIDTAHIYADWATEERGASERTIGQWLHERNNREQMTIATKGGHPDLKTEHIPRLGRQDIISDLEESLIRLGTDYIDLYWLHRDDPTRPVGEIIETLHGQAQLGKIKYYGCSNWRADRIEEARKYAEANRMKGFVANQNRWNLADLPTKLDPTMVAMDVQDKKYHESTGLTAIPYTSQAGGFFSGRYQPQMLKETEPAKLPGKVRSMCTPSNIAKLERAMKVAEQRGISGTQVALAYLMSHSFPVYPIIGSKTDEQLKDSCAAAGISLDQQTLTYLEDGTTSEGRIN